LGKEFKLKIAATSEVKIDGIEISYAWERTVSASEAWSEDVEKKYVLQFTALIFSSIVQFDITQTC
jgi:hypothetical protein